MVKVREDFPVSAGGSIDLDKWFTRLNYPKVADKASSILLLSLSKQLQECTETLSLTNDSFEHGLSLCEVLDYMGLGEDTIIAGLLWGALGSNAASYAEELSLNDIVGLLHELEKFDDMSSKNLTKSASNVDKIRRMMLAIVDDIRVVMVKLAEHTCLMRLATNPGAYSKGREVLAELSDNIYAPLANRLGIGQIKWELEDLSFRFTHPDTYKNIAKLLDEKRIDRETYITNVTEQLDNQLKLQGIHADIYGRAKHIYSIWKKMKRKMVPYNEIYDVRALRVITNTIAECYSVLGIVHGLWQHIPNEFDDYIANPKSNGYQSLHTAVVGPKGRVIEIQIRTHEMHEFADLGIAAHWRYKEGVKYDEVYQQKISEIRQLLSWQDEVSSESEHDDVSSEFFEDRVYLLTPKGDIVDLPYGATPLDFAYSIHTDVGHRCRGAKVDGKMVPLTTTLRSGAMIEVLTAKHGGPSRDWLNPSLSFVKTARARAKIQSWFKKQDREKNANDGRELLNRELKRLRLHNFPVQNIVSLLPNCNSEDELYASIAVADIKLVSIINIIQKNIASEDEKQPLEHQILQSRKVPTARSKKGALCIDGVPDVMCRTAKCCNPLPGEDILGYVTVGTGVSVHRKDCENIINAQDRHKNRMIEVSWGEEASKSYEAAVVINAYQRGNLLKDITSVLASQNVDVVSIESDVSKKKMKVTYRMTWHVKSIQDLSDTLSKVQQVQNVLDAFRDT